MTSAHAALVLASFLGKDTPFQPRIAPFAVLGFAGFAIGVAGHVFRSRLIVGTGIVMVFCAILVLPVILYLSGR